MKRYDTFAQNRVMIDTIYSELLKYLDNHGYIINPKNSYITNNYRKNDFTNLPSDEQEAYVMLQNLNKTVFNIVSILNFRLKSLLNQIDFAITSDTEKKELNKIAKRMVQDVEMTTLSIYASKVSTDLVRLDMGIDEYNSSDMNFYDIVDEIIFKNIEANDNCKREYMSVYKSFISSNKNIFSRIKFMLKDSWMKFKIYWAWTLASPELQFEDVVNTISPYPIDSSRRKYGEIFNKCIDQISYAVEHLNGLPIIELIRKYPSSKIYDYIPDKFIVETSDKLNEDDIKASEEFLTKLTSDICNDLNHINTMIESAKQLNAFIQRNVFLLTSNYCITNK